MIAHDVQEAFLGPGLLRTLVIIVVVFYAFRLFRIYVLPYLMKKGVEKMQKKAQDQMNQRYEQQRPQRPEGDISVENRKRNGKSENDDSGDYVDFEEVD